MCGIFFSLSQEGYVSPSDTVLACLERRGPDHVKVLRRVIAGKAFRSAEGLVQPSPKYLTFVSTVLCLRGHCVVPQPLVDDFSDSLLCWNGEAWRVNNEPVHGNDAEVVFRMLLQATQNSSRDVLTEDSKEKTLERVVRVISSISGPYAFVFYDAVHQRLYYGRDILGRRSLVHRKRADGTHIISSVCDSTVPEIWPEVEADGLYMLPLGINIKINIAAPAYDEIRNIEAGSPAIGRIPWSSRDMVSNLSHVLQSPFPPLNKSLRDQKQHPALSLNSLGVFRLAQELSQSLSHRVKEVPVHLLIALPDSSPKKPVTLAILFSGGLDCTVLARLVHDLLPAEQSIDLLNVAFENPRVVAAGKNISGPNSESKSAACSPYSLCPDRNTGLISHEELRRVCPGRTWRFVSIDIPYTETLDHRAQVKSLIRPHDTEMDISIAYALYFAARGSGTVREHTTGEVSPYTTSARILLSGLGADELFAGYTRHATAFSHRGYPGLLDELELDFSRLGKRNLGRDDRVISHWGREVRYPYLDERLVSWALECPVWEKCGFGNLAAFVEANVPALEPGKKLLRLLAWELGMSGVATEKKRAIQFGARTAKMERGKTKGTQVID